MKTQVLPVNPQHPEPEPIAEAAALIRQGEVVAFPTETVYGLGADALNPEAVARVFAAKERPAYDPLIVHVADVDALHQLAPAAPPVAERLARRFWPGPLTLVVPKAPLVPDIVTAGRPTVAVRCPAHPVALALIRAAGVPIAAPSANRFGHTSPTTAQHVLADLGGRIPLVLDGGPTQVGVESTVVDLTQTPPLILRPGGVSREALAAVLGEVALWRKAPRQGAEATPAPGMLERHYAPRTPLWLFWGERAAARRALRRAAEEHLAAGRRVGVLAVDEDLPLWEDLPVTVQRLGPEDDLSQVARRLFAALRALDGAQVHVILTRDWGERGLGLALRDRLRRAAEQVIEIADNP